MKRIVLFLLALCLAFTGASAMAQTNVAALKGPTAMGMVQMMQAEEYNLPFLRRLTKSPPSW